MVPINVSHTLRSLEARLELLPRERMSAAVRALNRTMTTVRAQAARDMAPEYPGVKLASFKRQMRFKKATRGDPSATLTFSNKRLSLFRNFSWSRVGLFGVRFRRLPWRIETASGEPISRDELRRAFLNRTKKHGQANVFIRLGKERIPFEVLLAPSLSSAFVERRIGERLKQLARTRFPILFAQEAKYRLSLRT